MPTTEELNSTELDVDSNDGTVPTEIDTSTGKTLTQPTNGSAIETGAIRDLAFQDIASELSGTKTLTDTSESLTV